MTKSITVTENLFVLESIANNYLSELRSALEIHYIHLEAVVHNGSPNRIETQTTINILESKIETIESKLINLGVELPCMTLQEEIDQAWDE